VSSKSPNIFTNATSPFTHEPVANDVTYYYVLTATVAGGISRDSALDSAKPYEGAVARPDPPTNFKAVPGDSLIKLTWDVAVGATRIIFTGRLRQTLSLTNRPMSSSLGY